MSRILKSALVLACGAITSLALTGGPAAASSTYTSKSVTGAYGSIAGIKWTTQNEASFRLLVKDTRADGLHAEGTVEILQMNGGTVTLGTHKAVGKGHIYYNPNAHVFDRHPISGIRIWVCRAGVVNGTSRRVSFCGASPWAYRPI